MNTIDKILNQKAVRITPMRQFLLEFFVQEQKPFGLTALEKVFLKAERTTIYRTLKTFEEKGIVHCIENGATEVKYALCKEHCTEKQHIDQHPHFHCVVCQQTICLESVLIPSVHLPEGFEVKKLEMTIKGRCNDCQDQ